jgi:L-ascorbate metabolism protein UlaG (beta-lactamase superfamily)
MELQFYGANCLRIGTKKANIVIDDNLEKLGLSSVAKKDDIVLATQPDLQTKVKDPKLVINMPGEFEVSAVSIIGTPVRGHMEEEGGHGATVFKLVAGDIRLVVVGHIYPSLTEEQLEAIGTIDILVVPVGGNGYTLDATGALKVIKAIEPKVVIPTHYADSKVKYEVPQAELQDALKNMNMEPTETLDKLKVKSSDLPESTQLIVLNRQ